ncbi:chromate transporter [Mycoplasmopsis iners]|uniref:chromate transporter n=1 Tax=Mycoplasmopsis iners TaxID=76630 RepID=UPI000494FCBC|nr:chromate transporter [Mycoplasmopsis iners]
MFIIAIIFALAIISLSVFGGGQVFMPMFKWLWEFMNNTFAIPISETNINQIFTVANATPGVVSTKFAFFTGFLAGNSATGMQHWWAYALMFVTYLCFCLPAILIMAFAMKYLQKFQTKKYIQRILLLMKPIVAGIIIALAFQLLINILLPFIKFNEVNNYFAIDKDNNKARFFSNWRLIALFIYVPINIGTSYWLYKKKLSLFLLIVINILLSLIIFEPWL